MRKGQVWIETVIYTLIGLSLIGLVLALVTPKVNEYKDKALIDQTIAALNTIDGKIGEIRQAPGNVRNVDMSIKRGTLMIDSVKDTISFELNDSNYLFSEPGEETTLGNIHVLTTEVGKEVHVRLSIPYDFDLTADGANDKIKSYSIASVPYKFAISNQGFINGIETIDIREAGG